MDPAGALSCTRFSPSNTVVYPRRMLTDGFAADSTGTALEGLPDDTPLAGLQSSLNATYRESDCQRATASQFDSAGCLCNATQPYLHCNAMAAKEASAAVDAALRSNVVSVDPATLKPAQWAQCSTNGAAGQPLDATSQDGEPASSVACGWHACGQAKHEKLRRWYKRPLLAAAAAGCRAPDSWSPCPPRSLVHVHDPAKHGLPQAVLLLAAAGRRRHRQPVPDAHAERGQADQGLARHPGADRLALQPSCTGKPRPPAPPAAAAALL